MKEASLAAWDTSSSSTFKKKKQQVKPREASNSPLPHLLSLSSPPPGELRTGQEVGHLESKLGEKVQLAVIGSDDPEALRRG